MPGSLSSRPRRPSPPPSGARVREPQSPDLLARTLPSTATLNALATLSRVSSELQIAAPTLMPFAFTTETAHWSIPPTVSDLAEWTVFPTVFSKGPINTIKRVLGIDIDPEYQDVVLDYPCDPCAKDHVWSCKESTVGRIWTVQPRPRSILEYGQVEKERAYRIPDPEDRQKLLDYYSDVFKLECGIQKCAFAWEEASQASEVERYVGKYGKIIVAKWPPETAQTTVPFEGTENVVDGAGME